MGVEVRKRIASISAENTFTTGIEIMAAIAGEYNRINLSISGTFVATVIVQRSFADAPTTWFDVETFTAPVQRVIETFEKGVQWRAGVKTSDFTSGPVELRFSF